MLPRVLVLAVAGLGMLDAAAHAQAISHLYAAQPPAGSTYVRVANPAPEARSVSIDGGSAQKILSSGTVATPYRIVEGGKPLTITIDGAALKLPEPPKPDGFLTVLLRTNGKAVQLTLIEDEVDRSVGLKAELRFYDLATGCTASLAVAGGPTVFDQVPEGASRHRSINPVEASLVGTCGQHQTQPLKLPALKAGDHYSIFLIGSSATPELVGSLDETEPYQGPAR